MFINIFSESLISARDRNIIAFMIVSPKYTTTYRCVKMNYDAILRR